MFLKSVYCLFQVKHCAVDDETIKCVVEKNAQNCSELGFAVRWISDVLLAHYRKHVCKLDPICVVLIHNSTLYLFIENFVVQ